MNSRLDNEFSAFLQAQIADPEATGRLEVRCGIPLKDKIDPAKLQGQLDRVAEFTFTAGELEFLGTQKEITAEFLDVLKNQILTSPKVLARGDDIMVRVDAKLNELPFWEVPISNLMHDLYFTGIIAEQNLDKDMLALEGIRRFQHKGDFLRGSRVMFTEAGTRWRYSLEWYDTLMMVILGDMPNLILGTTNPLAAMAHAIDVVHQENVLESPSVESLGEFLEDAEGVVTITGVNAYEMAHLHSHFRDRLVFEWGADLTSDMGPGGIPLPLSFSTQ